MAAQYPEQYHQQPQPPQYQQHHQYQQQQHQQQVQYQQPQQYQQQQPNTYGGYNQQYQYQQYPQHPPQQHGPQQYPPQQYPQQQYPQQQYSQQQYSSQQYTAPHQRSHQQPYQQPGHSSYGQPPAQIPAQPSPQTCYNCGLPDHFAQDCPEPKREVPAGSLNPQNHRRPHHHPRHSATVVTKFPPSVNAGQAPPQGYAAVPYSQPPYPQYQAPYTPGTPQSAQSPAQHQWSYPYQQQPQHYPQHQQGYQQGGQYQQGSPYSQQQHSTPATPAPGSHYGPQQMSQSSPQSSHGYNPQTPRGSYAPAQAQHSNSASPQQFGRQRDGHDSPAPTQQFQQGEDRASASMQPQSISLNPQTEEATDGEPEEDDLNSLDVPDLPPSTQQYGAAVVPLISMPLPSNFVVADALVPMAPPAPADKGCCQSKYLRLASKESLAKNIKDTIHWKDHKEDTIFLPISNDGNTVSVHDCLTKIKERRMHREVDVQQKSRSESRSVAPRPDVAEMSASLETLERALQEAKAKQAELMRNRKRSRLEQQTAAKEQQVIKEEEPNIKLESQSPAQSATPEKAVKSEKDTENALAALGVTGTAKPVGAPTRLVSQGSPMNDNDSSTLRSRSSSKADVYSTEPNTMQTHAERQPPMKYMNGSIPYSHQRGQAPPPPPPRNPSYNDGDSNSPLSTGLGNINPYGYGANGADNGNNYFPNQTGGQAQSPVGFRSEKSGSHKRSYDNRASSSDEEEAPARRQEDDVTPKLKRRQPKVAEAYSRRW